MVEHLQAMCLTSYVPRPSSMPVRKHRLPPGLELVSLICLASFELLDTAGGPREHVRNTHFRVC